MGRFDRTVPREVPVVSEFISPTDWKKALKDKELAEERKHRGHAETIAAKCLEVLARGDGQNSGKYIQVFLPDKFWAEWDHPDVAKYLSELAHEHGWQKVDLEKTKESGNPPLPRTCVRFYFRA